MFRFLFVCSSLVVLCLAARGNGASKLPSVSVNATEAVSRAATWLLNQRQGDYTWGAFTPRAIVALALAEDVFPLPQKEWNRMLKQLNILLSLELGKDGGTKALGPSRLALFANALYATCQDPRNFHGLDLIRELRSLTYSADNLTTANFSLPAVFLPLCFAGESTEDDFRDLVQMYLEEHKDKLDLQAIDLMAMDCVSLKLKGFRSYYQRTLQNFAHNLPSFSRNADVYTRALVLQALNANDSDVSSFASLQGTSGSFGSLLATYLAIPTLLNTNLLALKNRRCKAQQFARMTEAPPPDSDNAPKVYYSIYIGEGLDRDTHTITVSNSANRSLFEIMNIAKKRNPLFKFSVDETSSGKKVYSMAGQPNDVERELYWNLYLTKDGAKELHSKKLHSRKLDIGVDRIIPAPDDHYIFWFKRQ